MSDPTHLLDDFQREQVKKRLRRQAASLWGYQESEMDDFDPLVDLLLSACAVEFERIAHETVSSQKRILKRLAHLMVPEVLTGPRPAHAVLTARPAIPTYQLKPQDHFTFEKEWVSQDRSVKASVRDIYFSPAASCPLLDGAVRYQAFGNKLIQWDTPLHKGTTSFATTDPFLDAHTLWLGLHLSKQIKTLSSLTFFFDWVNEPEKKTYLQYLPFTRWWQQGRPLPISTGMSATSEDKHQEEKINYQTITTEAERQAVSFYQDHFITLTLEETVVPSAKIPAELEKVFPAEALKNIKEELIWFSIQFPGNFPVKAMDNLYCAINCFPVLNRRLHESNRPFALTKGLNIIPLKTEDQFFAVKNVFSAHKEYQYFSMDAAATQEEESYSVKQEGIARFDAREAAQLLRHTLNLTRDESAVFRAIGGQALVKELHELHQQLSRIEHNFMANFPKQSSTHFLLLNAKEPQDIWISFWSTTGVWGNHLPLNRKPKAVDTPDLQVDHCLLMTKTTGGREALNDQEKLYTYKSVLLTRSRLITPEDIKAACFAELGNTIKKVTVQKGVTQSPVQGLLRTIDVVLSPSDQMRAGNEDWANTCRELQVKLEAKKSFLTHIRVYINGTDENTGENG